MPRRPTVERIPIATPAAALALLHRSLSAGHDQLKAVRPTLDGGLAQVVDEHLALTARIIESLTSVEGALQNQQDLLTLVHGCRSQTDACALA